MAEVEDFLSVKLSFTVVSIKNGGYILYVTDYPENEIHVSNPGQFSETYAQLTKDFVAKQLEAGIIPTDQKDKFTYIISEEEYQKRKALGNVQS